MIQIISTNTLDENLQADGLMHGSNQYMHYGGAMLCAFLIVHKQLDAVILIEIDQMDCPTTTKMV